MSQTEQEKPASYSTASFQLHERLEAARDLMDTVQQDAYKVDASHREALVDLDEATEILKDDLHEAKAACERLEDAPWALDVSNDGTFILTHGDVECPQYVINELLATVQPVVPAWME